MRLNKIILFIASLFLVGGISAKSLMFRHIEAHDGLSNSQINCVFQDSRGFMWFGTSSGLNRYDGHNMVVYRTSLNDLQTLPDSYIHSICEDREGNLWVRTSMGHALYRPGSDDFDRDIRQQVFRFGLDTEPTLVSVDKKGDYWFYVSGRGCYWYSVGQKILYPFLHGDKPGQLPMGEVVNMTECNDGMLLIFSNGLLACVNGDKRRVVWMNDYLTASSPAGSRNNYAAFADKNDNIWVYGTPGLRVFNKEQGKWIPSLSALAEMWGIAPTAEMNDGVVGVGQDAQGALWIATRHYGLLVADPQQQRFTWARADQTNERALLHNSLRSLYVSPDKSVIWLGTAKSGLAYYSESAFKFQTDVKYDVTAIAPAGSDAYWLATSKHGILGYNTKTGEISALKTSVNLPEYEIFSLLAARDGSLWAGTNKGLVLRLHQGNATTFPVVDAEGKPAAYAVTSLLDDERGNIWIATLGGGLQCLDPRTSKRVVYGKDSHRMPSDKVNSLSMTKDKKMLIGTPAGVVLLQPESGQLTSYTGCQKGNTLFTSQYVNQVIEDSRGLWWIATRDGINIYNPKTDELDVIGAAEGFRNAVVCGLAPSGPQMVWASTAGGVTNIVVDKNDAGTGYLYRIYNYTEEDGLQGYEFNQRSIWVKPDGEVAVGGIHGLNVFHPSSIVYNKKLPRVIFSSLRIFDREVGVGERVDGEVIMQAPLAHGGLIELDSRKHKVFTVTFGSDDYSVPFKNRFKYCLEGFDSDWHDCFPLQHGVTFTNLSPGKYQLKVKAANSDGYSGTDVAQLTIVVKGPFWTSFWAYLIYIVLGVLLLVAIMLIGQRRLQKRYRQLVHAADAALPHDGESLSSSAGVCIGDGADPQASLGAECADDQSQAIPVPEEQPLLVLVDDNEEFLAYIQDCLSDFYRLIAVTSVETAWERVLLQQPDAVVLSVTTAESDVYALCARIKGNGRTAAIPVLMLVGRQMQYMPADSLANASVMKPFTADELRHALQLMLAGGSSDDARQTDSPILADAVEGSLSESASSDLSAAQVDLLVANATRYVEENLSRPDLSVEEMARHLGMSRAHFYKRLMTACDKTPVEFIRLIRLKHAAELLKDPRYNVSEVAYQVGFNSPKYFSRYFADVYGVLPSVYQDKFRDKA